MGSFQKNRVREGTLGICEGLVGMLGVLAVRAI